MTLRQNNKSFKIYKFVFSISFKQKWVFITNSHRKVFTTIKDFTITRKSSKILPPLYEKVSLNIWFFYYQKFWTNIARGFLLRPENRFLLRRFLLRWFLLRPTTGILLRSTRRRIQPRYFWLEKIKNNIEEAKKDIDIIQFFFQEMLITGKKVMDVKLCWKLWTASEPKLTILFLRILLNPMIPKVELFQTSSPHRSFVTSSKNSSPMLTQLNSSKTEEMTKNLLFFWSVNAKKTSKNVSLYS